MPYIPHTEEETRAMLDVVGVRTLDDLFADIEPSMRPRRFDVPEGQSEMDVCARLEALAARNHTGVVGFLGAGFYDHHIPKAVDAYGLADALTRQGYVPGFPVGRYYPGMDKVLLVACTEKHSREQIGVLAELMGAALRAQTTKGGLL